MEFYSATKEFNTMEKFVPAPYLRGTFNYDGKGDAILKIAVVGIYEIYLNEERITIGYFAPQRTNPNHRNYIETYDLTKRLKIGKNIIAIHLGNGFSCSVDEIWDFAKTSWISAPKIALKLVIDNNEILTAKNLLCHPSEVRFDDFHAGEHIDNNYLIKDWKKIDFDDSKWCSVIKADSPKGKLIDQPSCYVKKIEDHKPVKIIAGTRGYIFDFGKSMAGTYILKVKGEKNKTYNVYSSDGLLNGKQAYYGNMTCNRPYLNDWHQCDRLTLSGEFDTFQPKFSYKGCRYIEFANMSKEEAETVDITFIEMSSISRKNGTFKCDNEVINELQKCVENSDTSNFLQYPTDCPQREKNGWTADATLSAEQFLLNYDCAEYFKVYVQAIVDAQRDDGSIPGIVPTDTWGFAWGAGPGWDNCLFEIPYRVYVYTGDIEILKIVAPAIKKYFKYMLTKEDSRGLFHYGLEDWLPVFTSTPLEVTDTILCKSMCDTAAKIFNILGDVDNELYAKNLSKHIKENYLKNFPISDPQRSTQTQVAMGIYYGMYGKDSHNGPQQYTPYQLLKLIIELCGEHMDVGAIGNRVLWRILGDNNDCNLAVKMITQDSFPSFKSAVLDVGFTTMPEGIITNKVRLDNLPEHYHESSWSFNHHFWGDISAFFYRYLAGIKIDDYNYLNFSPIFSDDVHHIEASQIINNGILLVDIFHDDKTAKIKITIPNNNLKVHFTIPKGYVSDVNTLTVGENIINLKKISY